MMNLADSLKEQMGTTIKNTKDDRIAANRMGDQMLAAAVLRQAKNYEMPKKATVQESQGHFKANSTHFSYNQSSEAISSSLTK